MAGGSLATGGINYPDPNGYWKVDGTTIYTPASNCKVEHSNITSAATGHDEGGTLRIGWVRRDMVKIYYTLKTATASEVNALMNIMQGREFTFTYRDRGQTKTANCYCGESSYEFYTYADGLGEIYKNFAINVIEK